jgi:hypothetical protein
MTWVSRAIVYESQLTCYVFYLPHFSNGQFRVLFIAPRREVVVAQKSMSHLYYVIEVLYKIAK